MSSFCVFKRGCQYGKNSFVDDRIGPLPECLSGRGESAFLCAALDASGGCNSATDGDGVCTCACAHSLAALYSLATKSLGIA